jgi:hypothetical protein
MARDTPIPRTFFLNEHHELAHGEKESGGSLPKLAPINWQAKGDRIFRTLTAARAKIGRSRDPLRENRYFLAALPEPTVKKESRDVRRAPKGIVEEPTEYAGEHSRVFRRLGLDLLAVDEKGRALVHATPQRMDQLLATASALPAEGLRERARWITIGSFDAVPTDFRVDETWLKSLPPGKAPRGNSRSECQCRALGVMT